MVSSSCTDDGNECQNGGVCILVTDQSDGNKTPANYCQCPKGTSGEMCHGVDVCPLNCQHGSSCRHYDDITHGGGDSNNDDTHFYCECSVGDNYKGKLCNIPFTTCPKTSPNNVKPLQCLYGGECKLDTMNDGGESYHCSCTKGRFGDVCQSGTTSDIQDYNGSCLADSECGSNGLCIHKHDSKITEETGMATKNTYCQCSSGYGGDNCELDCDSLRCQHGSSCRFHKADDVTHANDKSDGGAYCDCGNTGIDGKKDGKYKGLECEIEVQVCPGAGGDTNKEQRMECLYGGSCVGSQDDTDGNFYNCDCPTSRMGTHCEIIDVKEANINNKEVYGGGKTNNNNIIQNNNDVLLSQQQKIPTNVIVYGSFVVLFLIVIIVLGLIMCMKSKRRKQNLESQRSQNAISESLDEIFNDTDNKEVKIESNNEDLDGGIVNDGFYNSNGDGGGGGDNKDDTEGIVNVNLDDDEPPHPKAEIV